MADDAKIQEIALRYVSKHVVGGSSSWPSTTLGVLHPSLVSRLSLDKGELVLVSGFFSPESWYAFTTRRIISQFDGVRQSLDPSLGIHDNFGNFKGLGQRGEPGNVLRATATITSIDSESVVRFEFETWEASMLPIYAARYWNVKHRVLGKLMTSEELQRYKTRKS